MRNCFERLTEHFSTNKYRILWTASYFRRADGKFGEKCSSYDWWRGLLRKNAFQQGLDPGNSSSAAPFVINELSSTENFLRAIKFTFSNHKEDEESRKALKALRQGKETIEQF
jgi:hypothetical protein